MSIECNDNNNKNVNIIFVGNLLKFQSKKYNKENLKWIKSDIYWYFIDWYIFYFILEKNSNDKNNVLNFNYYVNNFNNYSEISSCHLVNINRLLEINEENLIFILVNYQIILKNYLPFFYP